MPHQILSQSDQKVGVGRGFWFLGEEKFLIFQTRKSPAVIWLFPSWKAFTCLLLLEVSENVYHKFHTCISCLHAQLLCASIAFTTNLTRVLPLTLVHCLMWSLQLPGNRLKWKRRKKGKKKVLKRGQIISLTLCNMHYRYSFKNSKWKSLSRFANVFEESRKNG